MAAERVLETMMREHFEDDRREFAQLNEKVDSLQSFADNLKGRFLMLAIFASFVGPLAAGLFLKSL